MDEFKAGKCVGGKFLGRKMCWRKILGPENVLADDYCPKILLG